MSDHDSVFFSDFDMPDRSTSASAPPALEIATESVFAFTVEYAKIFSDIRTHEDYYNFYEHARDRTKLPAPLQTTPFLFDEFEEERRIRGEKPSLGRNNFKSNQKNQDDEDPRRDFEKLRIGRRNHEEDEANSPIMWNPQARKLGIHHEDPAISRLQQEQMLTGSWSSPSAQNVFNTAQYLWREEEQAQAYANQQQILMTNGTSQTTENTQSNSVDSQGQRTPYFSENEEVTNGNQSESSEDQELNRSQPCRYYTAGYCSRGDKCFYSHEGEVQQDKSKKEKKSKSKGFRNQTKTANGQSSKNTTPPSSSSPEPFYEFDQLIGKIYLVSKDQQGCRFLQRKLEEKDPQAIQTIFSEVYDHITELMTDPFGNYLCQKLLEFCNEDQRLKIVEKVSPHLVFIAKNMHGTRAVQKLIECLKSPAQIELIKKSLSNHVVELIQDLNGNHVIQRCLNRLSPKDNQFIYDAVTRGDNCVQVATHRHGCCVLQRCIDHASENQKIQLIQEIIKNALPLVQDAYGNYVVQYVLDLPFPDLVDRLAYSFSGHIVQLSTQKFSSNVIEKCLKVGNNKTQELMITELMKEESLPALLQDPYANYVIQTALNSSDLKRSQQFAEAIRPYSNLLRNTPYGKRILSLINKGK